MVLPVNTKPLYNFGTTLKTLGRRCTNVVQMFCVYLAAVELKICSREKNYEAMPHMD